VLKTLAQAWSGSSGEGLTGNSFRVGGASFRYAMGVPVADIQKLGWWESDCYKLYIRPYQQEDKAESKTLMQDLDKAWARTEPRDQR
jgi:hypothetical protein